MMIMKKQKINYWFGIKKKKKLGRPKQRLRTTSGESLFAFSNRLKTIYQKAYPKHKVESSNTLIYKFKDVLPSRLKEKIESEIISHKVDDKKLTWSRVQKITLAYEVERARDKDTNDAKNEKEIPK